MNDKKPLLDFNRIFATGPFVQLLIVVAGVFLGNLMFYLVGMSETAFWRVATIGIGFYLLLNTHVFYMRKDDWFRYIVVSVIYFFILVGLTILITQYFSDTWISELWVEKMLFYAIIVFYLFAMMLMLVAKGFKQEWGMEDEY